MKYKLKDNIDLELIEGSIFNFKPIFVLDSLQVYLTPFTSDDMLEKEKAKWIGRDLWLWNEGDSLLFSPDDNLLKYVCFKMPERNRSFNNDSKICDSKNLKKGLFVLHEETIPFEIESMKYRTYSAIQNTLVCFNDDFLLTQDWEEVIIANDFSILFSETGYCGWKLRNPELYLVDDLTSKLPDPSDTSQFAKDCFLKALNFFEYKNFEIMDDKDESFLRQLSQLYMEIHSSIYSQNAILKVIATWLYDVADRYYPENMVKDAFLSKN